MRRLVVPPGLGLGPLSASAFGATNKSELTVVNGGEPVSLDPQFASLDSEKRIALALFEGLVTYDNKTSAARPGLARSWTSSENGLTYTWKLRKTVWSDGTPITAQTVVDSWLRELNPQSHAPGASRLVGLIQGARDYHAGRAGPATVEIKALDDQTLRLTFTRRPVNLAVLAEAAFAVVPMHVIERLGPAWTEAPNLVVNGPYQLEHWLPQDRITVIPNKKYWDPQSVRLNRIAFLPQEVGLGYKLYKKGEAQWLPGVTSELYDSVRSRRDFQSHAALGTYYYRLNTTDGTLQDPRVRRALALAIDRSELVTKVVAGGPIPAYSLTPPFPGYVLSSFASRMNAPLARKLLAEAGFAGGRDFPNLIILISNGESNRLIAEAIQQQWRRNLGIDVVLKSEDWGAYKDDVNSLNYQIARSAWMGDEDDPLTFLALETSDDPDNNTGFSDPQYDALVEKAANLPDGPERMKILMAAEAILMSALPVIPLFHPAFQNLIDLNRWTGWYANLTDIHPWKNFGPRK